MRINAHFIKISGAKIEVPDEHPVGTYDITMKVRGDIIKEEISDNQDGTVDKTYILKAIETEKVE